MRTPLRWKLSLAFWVLFFSALWGVYIFFSLMTSILWTKLPVLFALAILLFQAIDALEDVLDDYLDHYVLWKTYPQLSRFPPPKK